MLRALNNFLNSFENFCWRFLIAVFFLIAIPVIAIPFIFGFFSIKVSKEEIKEEQ